MSSRLFKTLLNTQQLVLFDYGNVQQLPTIDPQKTVSGLCSLQGVYYIYQKQFGEWRPLTSESYTIVNYEVNAKNDQNVILWVNQFSDNILNETKTAIKPQAIDAKPDGGLLVYQHNQNKILKFEVLRKKSEVLDEQKEQTVYCYQNVSVPYYNFGLNITIFDFTAFDSYIQDKTFVLFF